MRDLFLLAVLALVAGLTTRSTIVGVMTWIWVSLLSPQREVYGLLGGGAINFWVTAFTIMCWLASRERKLFPLNGVTGAMVLFGIWAAISTSFALAPEHSGPLFVRTLKTMILFLAVVTVANTPARIQATVWALVLSVGYYGIRGGGFTILTAGSAKVFGPEESMIEDNNLLGLALVVLLPLWNYLRITSGAKIMRLACAGAMVVTTIAIVGTYSRGALLALLALFLLWAIRSRWAVVLLMVGAIAAVGAPIAAPAVMPKAWVERMTSMKDAHKDASFTGRIASWKTSFAIAEKRPLIGGGFASTEVQDVIDRYSPSDGLRTPLAAHSIYFEVLGDHGFVGFLLYFGMIGAALFNTVRVPMLAKGRSDLYWANELARMLQLSIFGFLVGGAALSAAYYDLYLIVFGLTAVLLDYVRREVGGLNAARVPAWQKSASKRAPALAQGGKLLE